MGTDGPVAVAGTRRVAAGRLGRSSQSVSGFSGKFEGAEISEQVHKAE